MKKYFDKIILVLALAVLGAGVGLYYLSGGVKTTVSTAEKSMTGGPYQRISAPPSPPPLPDWGEPDGQHPQGDEMTWQYYVFTPPKIWWNSVSNKWEVEPPRPPLPFGLKLAEIKHTYYRLRFGGSIRAASGDPKDATLNFSDDDMPGTTIRMKAGDTNVLHQFKVVDFVLEPRTRKSGLTFLIPIVTIEDLKTNETRKLEQGVGIVIPGLDFAVLKTLDPLPVQDWIVKEAGQTLELEGNVTFRVLSVNFDFDNPSVTVEKRYPLKGETGPTIMRADYRTLTLNSEPDDSAAPAAPAATPSATPSAAPAATPAAPAPATM